jgi:hypothetical protein
VTSPADDFDELRALVDALCEESISAEQVRRLEAIVLSRPEAEAYYVQSMSQFADLSRRFGGRPAAAEQSLRDRLASRSGEPSRTSAIAGPARLAGPAGFRRRWAAGLLVAAIAACVLAAVGLLRKPAGVVPGQDPQQAAEPTDNSVAILLQAPGAIWDASGTDLKPALRPGTPLHPGWLKLKAGVAHIEFYSGASVILEGPAEFELISRTRAYCSRGKLRAIVPQQAQGFTIASPAMDLVDRGTEFGLRVEAGDATEVHVFQGKVDLYDAGAGQDGVAPRQELTTGQAARRDGPGAVRPIPPNPAAFQTAQDLAERARAENRERQRAWQKVRQDLARDSSVVAYYPFEPEQPWIRTLSDQANGRAAPRDGAVVGCNWVTGRWPGKHALEFRQVSDRVRLTIPGEFGSVTLAAWVRVDALPNQNSSLFMADKWVAGALHWQIGQDGTLILGVRSPAGLANAHYHAEGAFLPDRLGKWSFLAVVYDRAAGRVTHYMDGQPVSREALIADLPVHVGTAELGNWSSGTGSKDPIRYLVGCMDEFVMFSRALADDEVERLCAEGRPPE